MIIPRKKSLLWHFYPLCLSVLFLGMAFSAVHALKTMKQTLFDDMKEALLVKAKILQPALLSALDEKDYRSMDRICKEAGAVSGVRFTFVLPSGKVLADSQSNPEDMENHGKRVEFVRAVSGETVFYTRYSETLEAPLVYLALPVVDASGSRGVLRASFPVDVIEGTIKRARNRIILFSIFLFLLAAILLFRIFHSLVRPVHSLEKGAMAFARGDLTARIPPSSIREMTVLAEAMNHMAAQLDARIQSEMQGKNELKTLLSSMTEGVIALAADRRILRINPAAEEMFGIPRGEVISRDLAEAIRNTDFLNFVDRALGEKISMEADILFSFHGNRIVRIHASPLKDRGFVTGTVLVLQDVTRVKKLETMRRDFVANVSHEIRTPLTSILGFAETLMEEKELTNLEKNRFLVIISRNAKRLLTLVEDLLQIAALEREEDRKLVKTNQKIGTVFLSVLQMCRPLAEEREIRIVTDFPESLVFSMDTALVEQALLNLLENALKYSPQGSIVQIKAEEKEGDFRIFVTDHGIGIGKEDLPRITERFYRVDRARSRNLGGTGLGLAIVKHIMGLHGGRLEIESRPGVGSTFSLIFPK